MIKLETSIFKSIAQLVSYNFARKRSNKRREPIEEPIEKEDIPDMLDLQNFDYLQNINSININTKVNNFTFLQKVKQLYQQDDQECYRKMRLEEENLLESICKGEIQLQTLYPLLAVKRAMNLKFRRWDDIAVTMNNSQQIIKKQVQITNQTTPQNQQQILTLYNQYCCSLIFSDHDKLHSILMNKQNIYQRGRKTKNDRYNEKDMGVLIYQFATEVARTISKNQKLYSIYVQTLLMQTAGLLVLGEQTQALKTLICLTKSNFQLKDQQKAQILLITYLSLQNPSLPSLSQQLITKIINLSPIMDNDIKLLKESAIKAQLSQILINNICLKVRNKSIGQLNEQQFNLYSKLLCLIAQNYYLQGRPNDSQRIMEMLDGCQSNKTYCLLQKYIKMGIDFDKKNYQQILQQYQKYKEDQMRENEQGKRFYNPSTINQDMIRVNIHKLVAKVYKLQQNQEEYEQIETVTLMLEGTLGIYTMKEPTFDEQEELKANWRGNVQSRIPYYYIDLPLHELFNPDWNISEQQN